MGDPTFIASLLIVAIAASYALQIWVRYQRRLMIHKERLASIEKGIELPPLEQEIERSGWNVQRLLLLAGLVWIAIGVATFPLMKSLGGQSFPNPWAPFDPDIEIPWGLEWLGVGFVGIGIAHVLTYAFGRRIDREGSRR